MRGSRRTERARWWTRNAWARWSLLLALSAGAVDGGEVAAQTAARAERSTDGGGGGAGPTADVRAVRLTERGRMTVDGVLDESVWNEAEVVLLPYESFPGTNAPAPVETRCRVLYDEEALYVGCEASDPSPGAIRAFVTDRDDLDRQDRITLALSPFEDGRRAFGFSVNPYGVQGDAMYDESRPMPDGSWDAIWHSAGTLSARGYVVELAVPFRSLRFPERSGEQSWSFYIERHWPRGVAVQVQSFYEDEGNACRLCQVNRLHGLVGISPGRNVQLTPTLSAVRRDARSIGASGWSAGEAAPDVGLDLAWGVTSDINVNATLNPDFSQVEADAAQLSVNERFALFFPERRPFFQEGADLFSTPLQLAFTRTISNPSFGGKVTGKVGGNAFGILVADDDVNSLLLPRPDGSGSAVLEDRLVTGIGRYRRDLGGSATLGAMVTAREGTGYHNRVATADVFFRPLPALRVQAQYARSDTRYPDAPELADEPAGAFGGGAVFANAVFDNRAWFGQAGVDHRTAGFRSDAGFLPWTGRRAHWGFLSRRWFGTSSSAVSEFRLAGGAWHDVETGGGALVTQGLWTNVVVTGPYQSTFYFNPNMRRDRYAGATYEILELSSQVRTNPTRWLSAGVGARWGDAIDYANERAARHLRLEPSVTLRPGRRVDLRVNHSWQRLDTPRGARILDAHVSQARAVYNFSARSFLRAIVQYHHTEREPAAFSSPVGPERRSALSQLLFSYKVNPQTVLFVGYSDDRLGLTDPELRRTPLTATGRTFFLKLGYAWRP